MYTYGKDSRQFYDHCYIEGTVDFILAGLRHCLRIAPSIVWVMGMLPLLLQIKAKIWLCFIGCKLTGVAEAQKVYLSRPWRPYAQAVYIHCDLGKHILPVGWNNWGKKKMRKPYSMLNTGIREKGRLPLRVLRLESS